MTQYVKFFSGKSNENNIHRFANYCLNLTAEKMECGPNGKHQTGRGYSSSCTYRR
jgi:predicted N-acyltransferase